MANLIDTTYFVNEIAVAQVDFPPVADSLTKFIDKYEPIYLSRILGLQLYNDFIAGLAVVTPDQKWLDLRDGKEFTDSCGNLRKWTGFVNAQKVSPIAYYVYRQWLNNSAQNTTGSGQATVETENAVRVNIIPKVNEIWNQMVDLNNVLAEFLIVNEADYGKWKPYFDRLYIYDRDTIYFNGPNELFYYLNYLDL